MSSQTSSHHESNRAFYDRISEAYDLLADSNERAARLKGVEALDLKPGEAVLEVGCGTGNEILDLAILVGAQGRVTGIDISSGMLKVSQAKVDKTRPKATVDLRLGDARALPFPDASFDAAYSSFTLELFPEADLPVVLKEIQRVLKPGGRLAGVSMAEVKSGDRASALERVYIWMHRHFPHIVDCRPIDLPTLMRSAEFGIMKSTELAIWTMPVAVVVGAKPGR